MDDETPLLNKSKSPGEYIREELRKKGWTQDEFAAIIGRPQSRINEIINGKHNLTPEIAVELSEALGGAAELWLAREAAYRLSLMSFESPDVKLRSRLYELAPVKEMQKRGWIQETKSTYDLQASLMRFYGLSNIFDSPVVSGVMRKTDPETELTASQKAWVFRVRDLALRYPAMGFNDSKRDECFDTLRKLSAYSAHTAKVPKVLSLFGIRFVIVQPLEGGKIDGVTTWIDENTPVIGMSLRFDRIDYFWHTLLHEVAHAFHRDESIDTDMGDDHPISAKSRIELRADDEATSCLIPKQELRGFIRRYGPLYTESIINQFANKLKIHPAIIIGQLQHLGEIGYSKFRSKLIKVRDIVTPSAVTDGWGYKLEGHINDI